MKDLKIEKKTLGQVAFEEDYYYLIEEEGTFGKKDPIEVKRWLRGLQGSSRLLHNRIVKCIKVDPEEDPEYFI